MDWKRLRIKLYEWTCRLRIVFLLLSLSGLGFSGWWASVSLQEEDWLQGSLGLAAAGALLICLSFLSWFFPTLRLIRWWTTRQLYRGRRWLSRPGLLLAGVALVVLIAWAADLARTLEESPAIGMAIFKEEGRTILVPQESKAPGGPWALWEKNLKLGIDLLLVVALIAMLKEIGQARRRIVVQPFADYTVDSRVSAEARKANGEALSSLLRSEIAGITSLYKVIDEVSPSKTSVEATVGVEDVGERLKEAVGPDSKLKLFGVEIPVGSVATMIGWMVRGPRLIGSLHKEDESYVLLAEIMGGGLSGSWRVHLRDIEAEDRDIDSPSPTADEPLPSVEARLIRQMAYRIVAHLLSVGSPRWQAVRHYTEGLRYYRDTQRTSRDKVLNLWKAERAFIRALGYDQKFAQCHYNLGVVYRELQRPESSEAAFRQAMQESPRSFEAAYAMAQRRFDENKYDATVDCCNHAIGLCPEEARAWNLKGWALRRAREKGLCRKPESSADRIKEAGSPLTPPSQWKDIRWMREVAAALAWRALCRALRISDQPEPQAWIAAACTVNSGISYCFSGNRRLANQRFWQSIHLYRDTTVLRFEMGKARCQAGDWQGASDALESIFSYSIESADLAELLLYRLASNDVLCKGSRAEEYEFKAEHDYYRLLGLACCPSDDRETLVEGLKVVHKSRQMTKIPGSGGWIDRLNLALYLIEALQKTEAALLMRILQQLEDLPTPGEGELAGETSREIGAEILTALEQRLPLRLNSLQHGRERLCESGKRFDWFWFRALVRIRLAQELLAADDGKDRENAKRAADELNSACKELEKSKHSHSFQIRKQGLYRLLTKALQAQTESAPSPALNSAFKAVLLEPEGAAERLTSGRVYASLMDFDQARDELRTSWQLKPETEVLKEMASTGWTREASRLDQKVRKEELQRLAAILQKALHIAECGPEEANASTIDHGTIHFWLGRFRGELLEADAAIYNLRIARAMGFKPIETCLIIGQVCLEASAYDEAEQSFRRGLIEAQRQLRRMEAYQGSPAKSRRELRVQLSQRPAPAVGEERPINDLQIELLLGWALALSERRGNLSRALHLAQAADVRIGRMSRADKLRQRELRAFLQEVLGWICFQRRSWPNAVVALKRSVALQPSASAYLRLARAYLERGLRISEVRSRYEDLSLSLDAARVAERMDVRGRLKDNLEELRETLVKIERAGEAANAPVLLFHVPEESNAATGPDRAA